MNKINMRIKSTDMMIKYIMNKNITELKKMKFIN